jgi:hypothetical protein
MTESEADRQRREAQAREAELDAESVRRATENARAAVQAELDRQQK